MAGLIWTMIFAMPAHAVDLTWGGTYRAEAVSVQNSGLNQDAEFDKSYLLHHLILTPKIVAADGLTLYGRVDIFNSRYYRNTAMGEFFGGAPATGYAEGPSTTAATAQRQQNDWVQISHFYLKWAGEYGALFVGRVPMQFGLGITHNAGNGEFDHYFDTKDLIGYKFLAGNLSFMPMYGKVREGNLAFEDDINDYMFMLNYENPDSEVELGLFYVARVATKQANDAPKGEYSFGGTNASGPDGSFEDKTLNLFVRRGFGNFRLGFESSFLNGKTGVKNSSGKEVALDGYAIVTELEWNPSGAWTLDLKGGVVTGDDPNTTDKWEGYLVDRNYDLGMLMFNHVLGGRPELSGGVPPYSNRAYDVLGTKDFRNGDKSATDVEYLTNAAFVAPGAKWKFSDNWAVNTKWIWAQLQRSQLVKATPTSSAPDVSSALGVEWDLGMQYKPHDRLTFDFGTGLFWPGDAFRGGTLNLPFDFAYGFQTKAAVRF
jgi:hypothetical protein